MPWSEGEQDFSIYPKTALVGDGGADTPQLGAQLQGVLEYGMLAYGN